MAIPFLNHLDLRSVSELQNAILHKTTRGNASHAAGKIIYDTGSVYVSNGSAWLNLTGDITRVQVTADDSNSYNRDGGEFLLTISGDTGISTTLSGTTLEIDLDDTAVTPGSYGSSTAIPTFTVDQQGRLTAAGTTGISTSFTIKDDDDDDLVIDMGKELKFLGDGIGINWTDTSTGSDTDPYDLTFTNTDKGSSQNIFKTIAVSGQSDVVADSNADTLTLVAGSNVTITTNASTDTVTISSTDNNTDTLQTISNDTTNADRFVTFVTNATGAQTGKSQANFKFNPSTGTLKVTNLEVSGTQTISNETVQVVENNTILFEGATADAYETKLTIEDPTADRTATIPNASGTINLGYSATIGDGSATTYNIDHNLNSRNVIVQFYDSSSYETVYADAVRSTVNRVVATFASAPASGDITVLVTRVA